MDNSIIYYCNLLTELDNYKKKINEIYKNNSFISNKIYLEYIEKIDNLLFESYLKIEELINEKK